MPRKLRPRISKTRRHGEGGSFSKRPRNVYVAKSQSLLALRLMDRARVFRVMQSLASSGAAPGGTGRVAAGVAAVSQLLPSVTPGLAASPVRRSVAQQAAGWTPRSI